MTPPNMAAVFQARNRVIVRLYIEHGWMLSQIAEQFAMSKSNVWRILENAGAKMNKSARRDRRTAANRKKALDPAFRRKLAEATYRAWTDGKMSGRKRLYADEPAKRADYLNLRKKVGADEARRMMAAA